MPDLPDIDEDGDFYPDPPRVTRPLPIVGWHATNPDAPGLWRVTKVGPWRVSLVNVETGEIRRIDRFWWKRSDWTVV